MEEKDYASKGLAGTALGLGIGALGIWALGGGMNGNGFFGGRTGNNYAQTYEGKIAQLESNVALLEAQKYSARITSEAYVSLDNKINANLEKVYQMVNELDKNTALNTQGLVYENRLTNNKIDCCCEKMRITNDYENRIRDLADASIISYVNSTFIPGMLKLPVTSICPPPVVK